LPNYDETWVFDDDKVGLTREPFVAGIDKIIDRAVKNIPNAEIGFSLLFSASLFPGYEIGLDRQQEEYGGNWYYCEGLDLEKCFPHYLIQ
jgi:hypothetical protein